MLRTTTLNAELAKHAEKAYAFFFAGSAVSALYVVKISFSDGPTAVRRIDKCYDRESRR
jgi:hypothetical protein